MFVPHPSAMPDEAIHYLNIRPGKIYVDCTVGGAGHSAAICRSMGTNGRLIGLDQDEDAVLHAREALKMFGSRVHIFHTNYIELPGVLAQESIPAVDGILMDLGLSRHQLEGSRRGFSFQREEPLDMRMDIRDEWTAERIVREYSEEELADLFFSLGEERRSRAIARRIVAIRERQPIRTSGQLADIVCEAIPPKARFGGKIHPATRVFMALRIAVNQELDRLNRLLEMVPGMLNPEGRLCVLSFHSLEDRIVKNWIRNWEGLCSCPPDFPVCRCHRRPVMKAVTRKAIRPSENEVRNNPMARSTRLRAAEKL